jgi:hypothetical protein
MLISKRDRLEPYKYALDQTIKTAFTRVMAIHQMEMTDDEVEQIFIKPEHREQLRMVTPLLRHMRGPMPFASGTCGGMEFRVHRATAETPFMVPRYAMEGKEVAIPEALYLRLREQQDVATRWHGEFQLLLQILDWINGEWRLTTWEQIRFIFPAIVPLIEMSELRNDDKLRVAMRKPMKASEKIPTLPVVLRQACREATQIVSRAKLLKNASVPVVPPDHWIVTIEPRDEPNALFPDGIPGFATRLKLSR